MMTSEPNAGWAAGIGKRSRVKQIAWAWKGAPPRKKDLRLNALAGIAEGRKLRDRLTAQMLEAGATPEDAVLYCVFAEPDLSTKLPLPAEMGLTDGLSDIALVTKYADKLPIGYLVFVIDRSDPQEPVFGHKRPLIVEDPRAIALNEKALKAFETLLHENVTKGRGM